MNYENLASLLKYHLQTHHLKQSLVKEIFESIPDCIYEGEAYRVILDVNPNQISLEANKNLSWTKKINGVNAYLLNSVAPEQTLTTQSILRATISGVDLNLLIKKVNKMCPDKDPLVNPYANEEEILAVFIHKVEIL